MDTEAMDDAVLVTGAAGGIGGAVARDIAAAGRRVIAVDLPRVGEGYLGDVAAGGVDSGAQIRYHSMDQGDPAQIPLLADRLGDVVLGGAVLCAGVTRRLSVMETPSDVFDQLMAANLRGTFELLRLCAANMITHRRAGSIVVVGSVNSARPLAGQAVYSAAKAAIGSLAISASLELAPHGVRVNVVAPGAILTGMNDSADGTGIPLARVGVPADLVGAVRLLLGDESSYMTGSTVTVDGGLINVR